MSTPKNKDSINPLFVNPVSQEVCHPNAPKGGGGCGGFALPSPLGSSLQDNSSNFPHPFSPAGKNLRQEQIEKAASSFTTPTTKQATVPQPNKPGNLYFAIYYIVADNAFKKAVDTWRKKKGLSEQCSPELCYLAFAVKTEPDFKKAWTSIYNKATTENYQVIEGRLFTHASISTGQNQGLEFQPNPNDPTADEPDKGESTLQASEISALEALPWSGRGELWLHGCNTGVLRQGWCPAQCFADGQKVKTYGQLGFAYFSEDPDTYDRLDSWGNDPVYLRAYRRASNRTQGKQDGTVIPEKIFMPQ